MSSLLKGGDGLLVCLLSWLHVNCLSKLDIAITNKRDRLTWLSCLKSMDVGVIDGYGHGHLSIQWLILRNIRARCIQIDTHKRLEINAGSFVGLKFPSLLSINLTRCKNIGDIGVMTLGRGCAKLTTIDFTGCVNVTDDGISSIARSCPELTSIDLSFCWDVRDCGVSALAETPISVTNLQFQSIIVLSRGQLSANADTPQSLTSQRKRF